MLGNRKLIVDTHCEIFDTVKEYADGIFWNLADHVEKGQLVPHAIYIVGRQQTKLNSEKIQSFVDDFGIKFIFSNPSEGSSTILGQMQMYGIKNLALANKVLIIGGGAMDNAWPSLHHDSFLPKILDYEENIAAATRTDEIYSKTIKPYKFLFLNGRTRPHRKYLLESFRVSGLLDQSLWTWLDLTTSYSRSITYIHNQEDLLNRQNEIKYLPVEYEFDQFQDRINVTPKTNEPFIKMHLFKNDWGDVYIKAEPYIDTYFSLVTETVFEYPYSFRTEKIWKPIAMGHPWIVVANQGYYRDMHNLGFKSFGHVIDETFDQIENNRDRLARIAQVVEDLCKQDLAAFVKECYNVCKYNQQHLAEMRTKVRQEFPDRFFQFIKKYQFDE